MTMGLVMAEGAENVLTVDAFIDHCRAVITEDSVPGMNMRKVDPGARLQKRPRTEKKAK
jgi:hypothetical protein